MSDYLNQLGKDMATVANAFRKSLEEGLEEISPGFLGIDGNVVGRAMGHKVEVPEEEEEDSEERRPGFLNVDDLEHKFEMMEKGLPVKIPAQAQLRYIKGILVAKLFDSIDEHLKEFTSVAGLSVVELKCCFLKADTTSDDFILSGVDITLNVEAT